MWCGKCRKNLSECICPDLQERLNEAAAKGALVYKCCKLCGQHYERCKCKKPEFEIKGLPAGRPEDN